MHNAWLDFEQTGWENFRSGSSRSFENMQYGLGKQIRDDKLMSVVGDVLRSIGTCFQQPTNSLMVIPDQILLWTLVLLTSKIWDVKGWNLSQRKDIWWNLKIRLIPSYIDKFLIQFVINCIFYLVEWNCSSKTKTNLISAEIISIDMVVFPMYIWMAKK
mgnify:CR=1 FL=1